MALYHFRFKMIKWQNGFLGVSKAAALGWARGPGKRSERRSRLTRMSQCDALLLEGRSVPSDR